MISLAAVDPPQFLGYIAAMLDHARVRHNAMLRQKANRYRGDPYPGQLLGTLGFAYRVEKVCGAIVTLKVIGTRSRRLCPKSLGRTVRISVATLRRPYPYIRNIAWHVPPTCFRDPPLPDWSTGPR
jgi:hypothetical protein